MNNNINTYDIEIEQLRKKISQFEVEHLKPLKDKIIELEKKKEKELFKPIIDKIMNDETVGRRSHYCSPFYEFNWRAWKSLGWDSPEEYISSVPMEYYTFDIDNVLFEN
jgi:hypothetical protein